MASAPSPTTWTFDLNDTDPVFEYRPYADGPFTDGWQAGWSNLGVSPPDAEHNDGSGTSYHVTSFAGANVSISFFGIGISLYGESKNCTYEVVLDDTPVSTGIPSSPTGTLFSGLDLDNTVHEITLVPNPTSSDQTLNFTGAQLVAPASKSPVPERIDNQNTSVITYAGSWHTAMAHQVPNSQHPSPYFVTNISGSSASLSFFGRAIEVRGISNFGWWTYSTTLDGHTYNMNASSVFINPDAVLFFQDGLDESISNSLTLKNTAADSFFFSLNSITAYHINSSTSEAPSTTSSRVTSPTSPQSNASSNTGSSYKIAGATIAGIVIGVVAGTAVMALLLLFWFRRRAGIRSQGTIAAVVDPFDPPLHEIPRGEPATFMNAPVISTKPEAMSHRDRHGRSPSGPDANVIKRLSSPVPVSNVHAAEPSSQVSPSFNPPSSSTTRASQSADTQSVERIADAVVQRLVLRFGPSGHDLEASESPPVYMETPEREALDLDNDGTDSSDRQHYRETPNPGHPSF